MAKKVKKLTRKEILKEDEFTTRLRTFFIQFVARKRFIGSISAIVVGLIIIGFGINYLATLDEKSSEDKFSEALEYFRGVVITDESEKLDPRLKYFKTFKDDETKWTKTSEMFDAVSDKHPNTRLGKLALYYAGNCYYELGDFNRASVRFETYLEKVGNDREGSFVNLALEGLGFSNEMAGNNDKALEAFEKLIIPENKDFRERGLFNAARIYQAQQNNAKALELYKQLVEDFPMSRASFNAQKIITTLGAGT